METLLLTTKPSTIKTREAEILSLRMQNIYCREQIKSGVQPWEAKEYRGVIMDNTKKIFEIQQHIKTLKSCQF